MRKITQLTGQVGAKLRDRSRGVGLRLLEIARAARGKAPPSQARMKLAYSSEPDQAKRCVFGVF
jgi:IS5 family transposase